MRDLPPQGVDLRGLLRLLLRVLLGERPQGCRQLLSNSVIEGLHSLDSFTAGRPSTLQGRSASTPSGSTTNRENCPADSWSRHSAMCPAMALTPGILCSCEFYSPVPSNPAIAPRAGVGRSVPEVATTSPTCGRKTAISRKATRTPSWHWPADRTRIRAHRTPWTSRFVDWPRRALGRAAGSAWRTAFSTLPSPGRRLKRGASGLPHSREPAQPQRPGAVGRRVESPAIGRAGSHRGLEVRGRRVPLQARADVVRRPRSDGAGRHRCSGITCPRS